MAIKMISVKCPECGANLSVEEDRKQAFCAYCGTKIIINNENEHILRYINEAEVKQAELDQLIRLKELEIEQTQQQHKAHIRKVLTYVWLFAILAVFVLCLTIWLLDLGYGGMTALLVLFYVGGPIVGGGALLIFVVLPEKENEKELLKTGGIRFPRNLQPFDEQYVDSVVNTLKSTGFTNITTINKHDIKIGLLEKPGKVENISVDGRNGLIAGRVFSPDVPIVITYHGR